MPLRTESFTIAPQGPFSLPALATFGFGQREASEFDGVMRMAFVVDGHKQQAGVTARQSEDGVVHFHATYQSDPAVVQRQVARVLSLDHDGEAFLEVGRRDPVIGSLQELAPGLRPPLFYSPYEAAVWVVLSARRQHAQAARLRERMSQAHGVTFELAGQPLAALPLPEKLLTVQAVEGLQSEHVERLHGVARAATEGRLDVSRLSRMEPAEAMADLQELRGIGPFYSSLVVIRALGLTDVLPDGEPQVLEIAGRLYGGKGAMSQQEFEERAEQWRPFRTWATVLLRAAGPRLLETAAGGEATARRSGRS